MTAIIMDGKALSEFLKPQLRRYASELLETYKYAPVLVAVQVGNEPASRQYVRNKRRFAEELGFHTELLAMPAEQASTTGLIREIERLNRDESVTGVLLQLPLPQHVDKFQLFDAIAPDRDIDAVGRASTIDFYRGHLGKFIPCTPRGVLVLLDYYKVPIDGAAVTVIGRSDIAGKPLAMILGGQLRNATVTWCHRHTRNLGRICRDADIIISCAGTVPADRTHLITTDMVKHGACVIDVGFRRVAPGRFAGDVDFDNVRKVAGWITPNPGGTGPMTVVALMQNLIDAARYRLGLERASYKV
jgi:methylenetetrahydrofolate dehydrogenase (NADP+) / methenyltetrahydrofolate cyclohydrolase